MADPPEISISRTSSARSEKGMQNDNVKENSAQENEYWRKPSTYNRYDSRPWEYGSHQRPPWRRHFQDHELQWKMPWKKDCFHSGRVLIIDYVSSDANVPSDNHGKRRVAVAAQEFETLKALETFYATPPTHPALRVIHVSNCAWATGYFLRKFNIDHDHEMTGMSGFTKWARYSGPRLRNGKPFPNGRSWRVQTDPWRGVGRAALGLDYLKTFETPERNAPRQSLFSDKPLNAHMMHLNSYIDSRSPEGYDVSVQRLNVYVQRNLGPGKPPSPEEQKRNPYAKHMPNGHWMKGDEGKIDIESLDNSSTVVIFETSASMLLEDCLVQPRNELENRWRRLPFYLRRQDVRDDTRLAAQCINIILGDVFHALGIIWQEYLAVAQDHVNLLEDKIYENPADESRAPELWQNQAAFLKVDKVMWIHQDLIREMQGHLRDLSDIDIDDSEEQSSSPQDPLEWLSGTPAEYERLAHGVQEDLLQPTANLNDLMYKSVGIRDSRQSLQLGLSMWRLSWITFIFLPLTFIVSFFGMNVDIFGGTDGDAYPNVGWYFLAAVILMIFVLVLWFCVKHSLSRRRQSPYQRGLYEDLFSKLEQQYPLLWTREGAVNEVEPDGFRDKIKWRLIRRWFAPEETINKKLYQSLVPDGDNDDELGTWARIKRYLLKRWLPQIHLKRSNDEIPLADVEQNLSSSAPPSIRYGVNAITELAKQSTPIAIADAEPTAVQQISTTGLKPLDQRGRRRSSSADGAGARYSEDRQSSREGGMMFEERNFSDPESDAGGGAGESSSRERSEGRRASK